MTNNTLHQKIILIGPPGSGKNVIAMHLAHKLKLHHLNYRSLVIRAGEKIVDGKTISELRNGTAPFEPSVAFDILRNGLEELEGGFILDGYPKSADEAQLLSEFLNEANAKAIVFRIATNHETTKLRLAQRYVCSRCAYVIYDSQPDSLMNMSCMNCHIPLIRRSDDEDSEITPRLERYEQEEKGILQEFRATHDVVDINGNEKLSFVISDMIDYIVPTSNQTVAERGARILIDGIGLNMADPNILGTAQRVAKTMTELTHGYSIDAAEKVEGLLSARFPSSYSGMVILDPIVAVSLCSHHLLAVRYEVLFGYIPNHQSLGFSKIVKVISLLAAKPVLQEDFTKEIIEVFNNALDTKGIIVVVRGQHSCMSIRGEKSENSNITSDMRGVYLDDSSMREQFFTLARQKQNFM